MNPACYQFRHAGQGNLAIRKVYGRDRISLFLGGRDDRRTQPLPAECELQKIMKILGTTCVQYGVNTDCKTSLYMFGVQCEIDYIDLYEFELSTSFTGGLMQFGKDLRQRLG